MEVNRFLLKSKMISPSDMSVNRRELMRFSGSSSEAGGSGIVRTTKLAVVSPIQAVKPDIQSQHHHKERIIDKRHEIRTKPYLVTTASTREKIKFELSKHNIKPPLKQDLWKQKFPSKELMKMGSYGKETLFNSSVSKKKLVPCLVSTISPRTAMFCGHQATAVAERKRECEEDKKHLMNGRMEEPSCTNFKIRSELFKKLHRISYSPKKHAKSKAPTNIFDGLNKTYPVSSSQRSIASFQNNLIAHSSHSSSKKLDFAAVASSTARISYSSKKHLKSKDPTNIFDRFNKTYPVSSSQRPIASFQNNLIAHSSHSSSKKLDSPGVASSTANANWHNQRLNPVILNESISSLPSTSDSVRKTQWSPDILDVEMTDVSTLPSQELINGMQDEHLHKNETYYFVVDTNVLLSELKEMNEIKDVPYKGGNFPHIYIPWTVLQELDRLKSSVKMKGKVIEAIRYINHHLTSKNPRFHGQSAKKSAESHKSYDRCNDDVILNSCLQLQESVGKDKVILLTNDRNLSNKAIVSGVITHSMGSLVADLESTTKKDIRKELFKSSSNNNIYRKLESRAIVQNVSQNKPRNEQKNQPRNSGLDSNEKLQLDRISCEIKMMLSVILEPYLEECMISTFDQHGANLLPKSPRTLVDILGAYMKYWALLFCTTLPDFLKEHFQKILDTYDIQKRCLVTPKYIISVLGSVNVICSELLKTNPRCCRDIVAIGERSNVLDKECRTLQADNVRRNETRACSESINADAASAVFCYIWKLIHYLCGMTMDFLRKPHDFQYTQPIGMPSKSEFQSLLANLYPQMHKIKKSFSRVLDEKNRKYADIQHLFSYLIQFVPSLQIQVAPPPLEGFNISSLKQYCYNKDNEATLKEGYQYLEIYFQKLNECVHDPVWKQ